MRLLFPILIIALSGCGTTACLDLAQEDPKVEPIFGGIRTDINCIIGVKRVKTEDASKRHIQYLFSNIGDEWIAKPFVVIDLPFSFAADIVTLPYTIVWTIQHRPLPEKKRIDSDATGTTEPLPSRVP